MSAPKPSPRQVLAEIEVLNRLLISWSFADRQQTHVLRPGPNGLVTVEPARGLASARALKNVAYADMYQEQLLLQSYSFLMLDGALVQLQYEYQDGVLLRHRLAFLPSPDLTEYQNEPDLYREDPIYAEILERRVVAVPLRFDCDARPGVAVDVSHPVCHLTLGQYSRCRIPVVGPLTPYTFLAFVLRQFYNTAYTAEDQGVPTSDHLFHSSITAAERALLHIAAPVKP